MESSSTHQKTADFSIDERRSSVRDFASRVSFDARLQSRKNDTLAQGASFLCGPCAAGFTRLPPACFSCGALSPKTERRFAGQTCRLCRKKSVIAGFLSPFLYRDPLIQEMVHQLKYERIFSLASVLGRMLAGYAASHHDLGRYSFVIPLPLFHSRERVRGFNQSALIAQAFSQASGVPLRSDVLMRIKKQRPQVGLSHEERRRNVAGVFALRNGVSVAGQSILLLDDVKTSGATLEEAAQVLKGAGADEVWVATVAH